MCAHSIARSIVESTLSVGAFCAAQLRWSVHRAQNRRRYRRGGAPSIARRVCLLVLPLRLLLRLLILKWRLLAHGDPEIVAATPAPRRQVGGNQPPRLAIVGSREARGELADALPCGVH